MLSYDKCIVVYGLEQTEKYKLCTLGYTLINVTTEMVGMTLGEILNGFKFKSINLNPIDNKILILNNFSEHEIKQAIPKLRYIIKDGIMAISTINNINWTFDRLSKHLIEERNWHLSSEKGRKNE